MAEYKIINCQNSIIFTSLATDNLDTIVFKGDKMRNYLSFGGDVTYTANFATCTQSSGIDEVRLAAADFTVYPNPAKDAVTVQFVETWHAASLLCILDLNGKSIKRQEVSGSGVVASFFISRVMEFWCD